MTLEEQDNWVLYVDPDGAVRETITTEFGQRGIRAEAVSDSDAAEALLADRRPLCVVSEYELPGETGLDLLERARESHDQVPFVLCTESGSEQIASDAVTAGVDEYLTKRPLADQIPTLIERIEEIVETAPRWAVTETLKDRAMDQAPVGITIADMRLPDEPLIYVNDAFERLTGYSVQETIGRNCRFLQGDDSDEDTIARMRAAIENDEATAVELRNYRKDGTEFWNRVELAPIREEDGEATHYVGYQTEVTARKEAEIAARERANALERKQQKLESVLSRIEGLFRDVSVRVIHARTAPDIEQQVCDAFVQAEGYDFAWLGERNPGSGSAGVEVQAAVGDGTKPEVDPESTLVTTALRDGMVAFDGEQPVNQNDVTRLPTADGPSVEESLADQGVCSWLGEAEHSKRAVVPVSYRETMYGVVGIHMDEDHEFDDHDAIVLSTLGRIVGTALNAVRTQSLAQGEAVIELELSLDTAESFVGVSAAAGGCRLDHVGTIPPGEDPELKLFFEVTDAAPSAVVTAATERADIESATAVRTGEDENSGLVRLSISNSALIDVLVEYGGTITDASATTGTGSVTVQLTKDANPRTFVDEFESRVPGANLTSYRDEQRPQRTNQEFVAEVNSVLTDRQRDALQTAYASGFFDWPRQTSGDEVAEVMDITRATFHQHLRTAERKLLDTFFKQ